VPARRARSGRRAWPVGRVGAPFDVPQAFHLVDEVLRARNDGKTNARGVPRLLPLALFSREFRREGEFVRPPRIVQRVLFALLAPLAQARGYQAINPAYLGPDCKAAAR
jgi:hypothetical protein